VQLLALALVAVGFGGQYLVFRATARQELRRRYAEAILAAELQADSWAEELDRDLSEAS
jgi:hypothetical protein